MDWVVFAMVLIVVAFWSWLVVGFTDPRVRLRSYTGNMSRLYVYSGDTFRYLHHFRGVFLGAAAGFAATALFRTTNVIPFVAGIVIGGVLGAFRFFGPSKETVEAASAEYEEWYVQNKDRFL